MTVLHVLSILIISLLTILWKIALAIFYPFKLIHDGVIKLYCWWYKNLLRRILLRVVCAFVALAILGVGYLTWYVCLSQSDLPYLGPLIEFQPPVTGQIQDSRGESLIELAKEYRRITKYEDLPENMVHAILAIEDRKFFEHSGVDWTAIIRAAWQNAKHTISSSGLVFQQGGSSIDQQLTRLYLLQNIVRIENSPVLISDSLVLRTSSHVIGIQKTNKIFRKIEEIRLTLYMDRYFTQYYESKQKAKEEILARYASSVYQGMSRYGFAAGAEFYFNKPLSKISIDEAAMLAGIVKLPSIYAPYPYNLKRTKDRRDRVLDMMEVNRFITADEAKIAKDKPIKSPNSKIKTNAPAAVDHAFEEIKDCNTKWGDCSIEHLYEGRMFVTATVDAGIQRITQDALENGIKAYEMRHPEAKGLVQGSVVILRNRDAAILAEVGGRRYYKGKEAAFTDYNRVIHKDAKRQPGSAFKPFVYLTAFEEGLTLNSQISDTRVCIPMGRGRGKKCIENYDHKSKGIIPLRKALAESRNQATMRLARKLSIKRVIRVAHRLGIKSELEPYPTTALGASGVNLLELANAYRAMASGVSAKPYILGKIISTRGVVYLDNHGTVDRLDVAPESLELIREGLRGVTRIPGSTAYWSMQKFPIPIAGKTGTTNAFKDAWFVAFTYGPEGITIAVRIGFDKPNLGFDENGHFGKGPKRGLGDKETGGRAALPVCREIFQKVYATQLLPAWQAFPEDMERNIDDYIYKITGVVKEDEE